MLLAELGFRQRGIEGGQNENRSSAEQTLMSIYFLPVVHVAPLGPTCPRVGVELEKLPKQKLVRPMPLLFIKHGISYTVDQVLEVTRTRQGGPASGSLSLL